MRSVTLLGICLIVSLMTGCETIGNKCSWYDPLGKPPVDLPEDYLRKIKENDLYFYTNCKI